MDHGRATAGTFDDEDLDPGLARERTLLAWNRTGLAFMALGGSVIKLVPIPGISILAMGALIWGMGYAQYRVAGGALRPRWLDRSRMIRVIAWGTALVSLLAVAVAMLQPGH